MAPPDESELTPTGITEHELELADGMNRSRLSTSCRLGDHESRGRPPAAGGEPAPAEDPARVLRRALLVELGAHLPAGPSRHGDSRRWLRGRGTVPWTERCGRREHAASRPWRIHPAKTLVSSSPANSIQRVSAAVRATVPTVDPEMANRLYRDLSGDAHPDLRQFMTRLIRETQTGGYEMGFSPHRSQASRQSLFLYVWFAGEATERIGVDVGIPLPHHGALADRLIGAAANLKAQFDPGADPPGDVDV